MANDEVRKSVQYIFDFIYPQTLGVVVGEGITAKPIFGRK
jgi:hypothetical protein